MLPDPLHPAVVHFPIALAVLMPLLAGLAALAIQRDWLPSRAWAGIVLLQVLLVVFAVASENTGEDQEERVEKVVPVAVATRPRAYWIPPGWAEVAERLRRHGIEMERMGKATEKEVTAYRIRDPRIDPSPREGHVRVTGTAVPERRKETFPPGSYRVSTDQDLGDLAMVLLEPESPDSFFQWGFFLEILQQMESADPYVMEPLAEGTYVEATRRVNDERAVRHQAKAAVDDAAATQFTPVTEVFFCSPRAYFSFEEFEAEQRERGEKRRALLDADRDGIRTAFLAGAREEDGKLVFDRVFRVDLLQKPA